VPSRLCGSKVFIVSRGPVSSFFPLPLPLHHPIIGYLTFCVIKFLGYAFAARFLSCAYARTNLSAWKVSAARTLIGMATGALYLWAAVRLAPAARLDDAFHYLLLVPIRITEWWLILWFFYDRLLEHKKRGWLCVICGTLWSFVLDVPAILGLVATGGFPIC
jgi:hypothetical protein